VVVLRIEQTVQMHDEVAHMSVVYRTVGGVLPGVIGLRVIGIDADDIELLEIAEFDLSRVASSPPNTR
jgi:hypothetical protein